MPRGSGVHAAQRERPQCQACRKQLWTLCSIAALIFVDIVVSFGLLLQGYILSFIFSGVRLVLLILFAILAVKLGGGVWRCGRHSASTHDGRDVELPLATNDSLTPAVDAALEAHRAANTDLSAHKWKASLILCLLFAAVTADSVYMGVHVMTSSSVEVTVAVFLSALIIIMNSEFILVKRLVERWVSSEGIMFPALHEHPLVYKAKVALAVCSVCRQRIGPATGGYEMFRCQDCEHSGGGGKGMGKGGGVFTLCICCYQKQMLGDIQEGILRSDKGPKPMADLPPIEYTKRTLRLAAPYKINFVLALSCVTITQVSQVALPKYQGNIINTLIADNRNEFQRVLTMFVIFSVVSALFDALKGLTVGLVSRQISLGVRSQMFKSLVRQDMAFFDGIMVGQLTSRMTNDAQAVTTPIQQLMNTLLANLITLCGGFFMCFHTSWKLTVLALTLIGPVIYMTGIYARWSKEINFRVRASLGDANASATESLRNIRTVRSFGADEVEVAVVEGYFAQAWKSMRKDAYAGAGVDAISGYVNFSAGVLVYWYGGNAVLDNTDGQLTIGSLITFNLYWSMLRNSITSLNGMLNQLIIAASAAKRVFEIIDLEPDIKIHDPSAVNLDDVVARGQIPTIEFRDVHFTYQMRPDQQIFRGLSFVIPPGTIAAFVGKSGCGKSTTMGLLMRFYDPQAGTVLLEGRPLPEYNLRSFQRRIGIVSQETQIFARTVKENLVYGMQPHEYDDAKIEKATRQANAHEFIVAMDQGYNSMLGESGGRLSGGQKQRLSIARAFLRQPRLLLLDEATSALDSENEQQIQVALDDMVKQMAGSCTIIIIAHRLSTVMNADRIIVFSEGQVQEQGRHSELMENGKIYASLVKRQLALADKQRNVENATEEESSPSTFEPRISKKGKGKSRGQRDDIDFDENDEGDSCSDNTDKGFAARSEGKGGKGGRKGKRKGYVPEDEEEG